MFEAKYGVINSEGANADLFITNYNKRDNFTTGEYCLFESIVPSPDEVVEISFRRGSISLFNWRSDKMLIQYSTPSSLLRYHDTAFDMAFREREKADTVWIKLRLSPEEIEMAQGLTEGHKIIEKKQRLRELESNKPQVLLRTAGEVLMAEAVIWSAAGRRVLQGVLSGAQHLFSDTFSNLHQSSRS